jgi:hypothetical protein
MNENPPLPPESMPPLPPPDENPPPFHPPNEAPPRFTRGQCFGLGVLLFVVSSALCYLNPMFGLAGFITAVVCLFYKGYRYIFTGYILLTGVGLLVAIIYCFATFRVGP